MKTELINRLIEIFKEYNEIPICVILKDQSSVIIVKIKENLNKVVFGSNLADYLFRNFNTLTDDEVNSIYSGVCLGNFSIDLDTWKSINNYTDEDLDFMWDFCVEFKHPNIKNLNDNGVRWNKLSQFALLSLPKVYEEVRNSVIFDDFS